MQDQRWKCWRYHRRQRQVPTHSEFITLKEKVLTRLFRTFVPGYGETRSEVYRHSNVPHSEREKFFLNIEISAISLNCELA